MESKNSLLTLDQINRYIAYLQDQERSNSTVQKYITVEAIYTG